MILISGACGYIGSFVLKTLLDNNYKCVAVDNLIRGNIEALDKRAIFYQVDLSNKASLAEIFKKHKIKAVIHLAAYAYVEESIREPEKYHQNNVLTTKNLLEVMNENNVEKIVFSSSCAVYGEIDYLPVGELHSIKPINPYGQTKALCEELIEKQAQKSKLKYINLRFFNASGASSDLNLGESHNPETHLIPNILKALKNNEKITIYGNDYLTPDGTCIRDYIHVEDLAIAHKLALEKVDSYSGAINLGSEKGFSIKEIVETCEKILNKKGIVEYQQRRAGDAQKLFASSKKAKEILNWIPKNSNIENIIKTAWEWELNRKY